jgi:hypothetical protein
MPVQIAIVASGSVVSSPFGEQGLRDLTIFSPGLTSCQLYLQAATTASSADFRRISDVRSTGTTWVWSVGSAASVITVGAQVGVFPFVRIETSVAQTSARSFEVWTARPL